MLFDTQNRLDDNLEEGLIKIESDALSVGSMIILPKDCPNTSDTGIRTFRADTADA